MIAAMVLRQLAINKIHNESTKNRTQMTLIVMIDADFSWIIPVYHNHLRHLRSIVFVVYFLRVALRGDFKRNFRKIDFHSAGFAYHIG